MPADEKESTPLAGLLDTLELLVAQARAYERALPPDNYPARAAVAALGELARQALNAWGKWIFRLFCFLAWKSDLLCVIV